VPANAEPTAPEYLALAGAVLAAAGTTVPWVVTSPWAEVVPAVYLDGMGYGVAGADYLLLGVLAVGLAAAARHRRARRGGYIAAATGALVAVLAVAIALSSLSGFLGAFLPGPGAAVTAAGGVVLALAGWWQVATTQAGDGPAADRERGHRVERR
jgi:hypothetical protein